MKLKTLLIIALLLPWSSTTSRAGTVTEIKIATIAPRGSSWMRIMNKMKAAIAKQTKGQVRLRFYPGQVQGDERDVVRKIRTGQLQGGVFTAVGLSMINPRVLVLQMPFIFDSYARLDRVRETLRPDFERSFRKKGYVLLGWGDVGWIYIFSKSPIRNRSDLRKSKVWAWTDDPISKAMLRSAGVSPRLLSLPQVYPALNTGMVNAVYNAPLACLALQWHTKINYYSDFPLAIGIGALVVDAKAYDALSPAHQKIVKRLSARYHRLLIKRIRRDNDKALTVLRNNGIKPVQVTKEGKRQLRDNAATVAKRFAPRYYPKALLQRVLKLR